MLPSTLRGSGGAVAIRSQPETRFRESVRPVCPRIACPRIACPRIAVHELPTNCPCPRIARLSTNCPGTLYEAYPRTLCVLLEHGPQLERTCLARAIFLMPFDGAHSWEALRYTELNPVRAQLVTDAPAWIWLGAAAHCGTVQAEAFLSRQPPTVHFYGLVTTRSHCRLE